MTTKAIAVQHTNILTFPWGEANERRGPHVDLAISFKVAFPVNTLLTVEEFDVWAEAQGLYGVPRDVSKQSDAWLAMLTRRHQTKSDINKASAHPRMNDLAGGAYYIATKKQGLWKVETALDRILENETSVRMVKFLATKRRQLKYLLQSQEMANRPDYERRFAEDIYDDIGLLEEVIEASGRRIRLRIDRVTTKFSNEIPSLLEEHDDSVC